MSNQAIVEHMDVLDSALMGLPASPAFFERHVTTLHLLQHKRLPARRTVSAPYYVTDLGVREFSDPGEFYRAHIEVAGADPLSRSVLAECGRTCELRSLGSYLDAVSLFFGDYGALVDVVKSREGEIIGSNDYSLLLYSGCVLSQLADRVAIRFFEEAARVADRKTDVYGAQHRASAYEIKRVDDAGAALRRLDACERNLIEDSVEGALDLAILKNLKALAVMRLGRGLEEVMGLLEGADRLVSQIEGSRDSVTGELLSRAARYRSQVAINQAQVCVFRESYGDALVILRKNVEYMKAEAYDYLPEALAEFAYVCFLNERFDEAVSSGVEAFWRLQQIGSLKAMKTVREIVVASLARSDREAEAERIADDIAADVLGTTRGLVVSCR